MKMKRSWIDGMLLCATLCLLLSPACTDEDMVQVAEGKTVELQLSLSVPGGGDAQSRNTYVDGDDLDYDTELQRNIDDAYVLVFDKDGKLKEVPEMTLSPNQGDAYRVLSGKIAYSEEQVTLAVLTNMKSSNVWTGMSHARILEEYGGMTANVIYQQLTYSYSTQRPNEADPTEWNLESKKLPMWGQPVTSEGAAQSFTPNQNIEASCDLYRALAKIGVTVKLNEEEITAGKSFTLTQVQVYNVNMSGYCASLVTPNADVTKQYESPSIPLGVQKYTNPLTYTTITDNGVLNQIYVPEADNPDDKVEDEALMDAKALYLVVGGIYKDNDEYKDNGTVSYYHIFMRDDKGQTDGTQKSFDIIRNHSYIFNITKVSGPGTPDPGILEAEESLTVEVMDYIDEPMRGIDSQYTLTVDRSTFNFNGLTIDGSDLNIWTDGTEWELTDEKGNKLTGTESNVYDVADWLRVTNDAELYSKNRGKLTVLPKPNVTREDRTVEFYIKAGKILKKITVVQKPTETANSYIASTEQQYILYTGVPGNRNKWSSDNPEFNPPAWNAGNDPDDSYDDVSFEQDMTLNVDHIGIIWETVQGLIMVEDPENPGAYKALHNFTSGVKVDTYTGCIPYKIDASKKDQWGGGVLTPDHGGNALIGGFDAQNKLVWSWHIWVVGDYADGVKEEDWVTDIWSQDRYLGAYSRNPGSRSYGLLYQWGRKDPFIGPARDYLERDYKQVPKAKTINYKLHDVEYVWKDWSSADGLEQVMNTVSRPTTLLKTGILNNHNNLNDAPDNIKGIWGTKNLDPEIPDNGAKTMWDPCPPGYRVPSLHSWIFEDKFPSQFTMVSGPNFNWGPSEKNDAKDHVGDDYTSVSQNYDSNMWFVPVKEGTHWPVNDYGWWGWDPSAETNIFDSDEPYYGFWLYYGADAMPDRKNVYVTETGELDETKVERNKFTWLPLGGSYDGTMFPNGGAHVLNGEIPVGFGACGTISVRSGNRDAASSIHVNSGIWLNSPVKAADNSERPAGVFLHGTEGRYSGNPPKDNEPWYVNSQNGRHLHAINEIGVNYTAHPNYALNVRCVRDKDKLEIEYSTVDCGEEGVELNANNYQTGVSVKLDAKQAWYIVSPGAPWVHVTPDKGYVAGEVNLKITCDLPIAGESTETVYIEISAGPSEPSPLLIPVTRRI